MLNWCRWVALTTVLLMIHVAGCVMGPHALESNRVLYNEVIQRTTAEQLLLNLVRLQYRESPLFLDVASVSAQFKFAGTTSAGATVFEGPRPTGPNFLNLGGEVSYEESPTVSFAPLQGEDFVKRVLAPLPMEAIALLTFSGWRADRVLRLTVQEMNGLDNASRASGPTPDNAPVFDRFAEVCNLFQKLLDQGQLDIRVELVDDGPPIRLRANTMTAADTISALDKGYAVAHSEDGTEMILKHRSRAPVWRLPVELKQTSEVARLLELLRLDPKQNEYRFVIGKLPYGAERTGEINLVTRSLMGVLSYSSQAVDVPQDHRDRRWVTSTVDSAGRPFDWQQVVGDLLRVRSQRSAPRDAAVSVRYKGAWFFIANSDLTSKSTMALLSQLFALQAGDAQTVTPVLTLPVGG